MSASAAPSASTGTATQAIRVLLYSDDVTVRDAVRVGVGRRPARDVEVASWRECATQAAVVEAVENDQFDVLILDGEAAPLGGLGLCRQLKNEIFDCPPVLVLTGRVQDGWLAAWSQADAVVPHPADPVALSRSVADLARDAPAPAPETVMGEAPPPTWPDLLTRLVQRHDLTRVECEWAMASIMSGDASPVQVAGFLMALRTKGESVEEVRGLADQMLRHAVRIQAPTPSLDIVGTGGDRAHTVNISTMAAIVCAAAGVAIVKHGNRAASSASGSADVLEALGIDLTLAEDRVEQIVQEAGITFCFAQRFHPSMKYAAPARSGLGVGTVFNYLGPLTNPGQPTYAAVGVADERMAPILAGVFAGRGGDAAVFRGDDGLDEATLATTTSVWWVRRGQVVLHRLDPARLGLQTAPTETLRGGDPAYNAGVIREVFAGAIGPIRDAVVLNAGLALAVVADADTDLHADVRAGMARAAQVIDSGEAARVIERWVAATRGPAQS